MWTVRDLLCPIKRRFLKRNAISCRDAIVSNPVDIAETFNEYFTNIPQVLAVDIPAVDVNTEFYLETTDKSFSLQTPSIDIVLNLLKENLR